METIGSVPSRTMEQSLSSIYYDARATRGMPSGGPRQIALPPLVYKHYLKRLCFVLGIGSGGLVASHREYLG